MTRRHCLAIIGAMLASAIALTGQGVVLVPGTISGSFSLGNLVINQVSVYAYPTSGGNTSSVSVSPNASSGSYSLTVGVPQSGTQTFNGYAVFYTDQSRDILQTTTTQVAASAAVPGQLDFNITSVGFINASVSVSGGTLQSAYIYASQGNGYAYTNAATNFGFTFPTFPANNISVSGTAYLTDGRSIPLPSQTINVVSGQTTSVSFSVTAPANSASISGTVQFNGPVTANQMYVYASGPVFRSFSSSPPPPSGNYLIDGLVAGNYGVYAYLYSNNYDDYFQFPYAAFTPAYNVTVGTSQKVVDVYADQAFINTQLNLSGAPTFSPWINYGRIAYSGVYLSPAYGGYAQDQLAIPTSSFDSIVSAGTWHQDNVYVAFYRPAPYLNSYFYFYDNRPTAQTTIAAGETKSGSVDIALGELTISVSVAGGALMSSPSVSGNCTYRDGSNNVLWSSYVYGTNGASNVSSTQLTLAGPAGSCSLSVSAYVNGSYVSLPPSTFQIVAGASQVVDIGGPTLTITAPAADAIVTTNFVTVSGKATDDVAVASVTVNGTSVSLAPTGNPSDPAEVSFQRTVSGLQRGPNTITTVASDTSSPAKTATDTRTVYYDTAVPTLSFTPADGATTFSTSITVNGTANDDAGVKKITINGVDTAFTTTSNPSLPNEVSFTGSVSLSAGSNPITVVVTDISNRTTTQTHTVTRQQQAPTTLSVAAASATFGTTVSLSAMLSSQGSAVSGKTIQFTVNGNSADGVTNASGVATVSGLSVSGLNAGDFAGAITASFAGDTNFGSSSGNAQLTISQASQTITFGILAAKTFGDPDFTVSATSSSNLAVTFSAPSGQCSVSGNTVHLTGAGSCTIRASQAGNTNYSAAPAVDRAFSISKANQTITFAALADRTFGEADFSVSATAASGLSVAFAVSSGQCTMSGSTAVHLTGAGACTIRASQAGNGNYNAAADVDRTFNIGKASQTITFATLADRTFGDADFTVSATAASGLSVTLSALSGECTVSGTTVHLTGAGACTIRAAQGGDGNYNAAPDVERSFTIARANQTITFGMLAGKTFGDADFSVSATASSNLSVSFSAVSGQCSVNGGTVHLSGAGSCTVRASQGGNNDYNAAAYVDRSFNIGKASQAITIGTSVPTTAIYNTTFDTAATGGGSGIPVGITASGACAVNSGGSGSATILMTSGTGTCTVYYNQAGDANYNQATQVAQTVNPVGYAFSGFFQPIDMPIGSTVVWNTATAGQAIPAKWQLTLNSSVVSALSSYAGMYSAEVACGTGAGSLEDAIEEYAPGASNITYDGNGNFHINWKTLTTYKGKCRAFYVSFSDGSTSKVAYFKFK